MIDEVSLVIGDSEPLDVGEVGILDVFVFVPEFVVVEETFLGALEGTEVLMEILERFAGLE